MGGAGDQGAHQGIAIAAAGAADALQVVGRLRRHGGEQHGGEIADVDAHLQGGGGREQVRVAAVLTADELGFQSLAIAAFQQAGVFAGHDAVHFAALIEPPVQRQTPEGRPTTGLGAVAAGTVAHLAGQAIPEAPLFSGHAVHVAAVLAAHGVSFAAHGDCARWDGPDALTTAATELHHQTGLAQGVDDGVKGFLLLLGIQGSGWGDGAQQPVLGPGGPA